MRSELVLGTLVLGVMASALGACGSDDNPAGTGGTSASGSGGATSVSTSAGPTTGPSSGTGGETGDGNDTLETATAIDIDTSTDADLDPTGDVDYYTFHGNKGAAILVQITAEGADQVQFDPAYIDTIVTLFDKDGKQLAENDTPVPSFNADARLFTVLPADGDYYLRIAECWTWATDPAKSCAGTADKDGIYYTMGVYDMDPAINGVVIEAEPNDEATTATPIEYEPLPTADGYYYTDTWGFFATASDVDVYTFTVPVDAMPTLSGRETARFYPLAGGTKADGSATDIGKIYVVDPASPAVHLAEIDASTGVFLWPVLDFGKEYWLFVEHPAGTSSSPDDFYFFRHTASGSNAVELDSPPNDTPAAAEALLVEDNMDGSYSHFVDGDIVAAPADVDHYAVDATLVPPGGKITVACASARYGSGLVDLTATILEADGTPIANATGTETPDANVFIDSIPIPSGETSLLIRIEAASQSPTVSSTYYRCGFHLNP